MKIKKEKKEIWWACDACGLEANRRTCFKRFGQEPKMRKFILSTYHIGMCDSCGEKKSVTEARDFFYPDFDLLKEDISKWAN